MHATNILTIIACNAHCEEWRGNRWQPPADGTWAQRLGPEAGRDKAKGKVAKTWRSWFDMLGHACLLLLVEQAGHNAAKPKQRALLKHVSLIVTHHPIKQFF